MLLSPFKTFVRPHMEYCLYTRVPYMAGKMRSLEQVRYVFCTLIWTTEAHGMSSLKARNLFLLKDSEKEPIHYMTSVRFRPLR